MWVMWNTPFNASPLWESDQHITLKVDVDNTQFICSCVYASCVRSERQNLWSDLLSRSPQINSSWILMGDFNTILYWHEKKGGDRRGVASLDDFNNFLAGGGLSDAGHSGNQFTWCNNQGGNSRVVQRLDRVLINGEAAITMPNIKVDHLPRICSDHNPLLISFLEDNRRTYTFKFMKMWTEHPTFMDFVQSSWSVPTEGVPMHRFTKKLARLRKELKSWNWNTFGDINKKLDKVKKEISHLEISLDDSWDENISMELLEKRKDFIHLQNCQSSMLAEKANLRWVQEGDRNSKLFHASIKARRKINKCRIKNPNGSYYEDDDEVGEAAVQYFKSIIGSHPDSSILPPVGIIEACISDAQNEHFSRIPESDEIKQAVFDINPSSAPGPDGFNALFYQHCWSIIASDLIEAVVDYFRGGEVPKVVSSTNLVLIPKDINANCFDKLRPISLCNVLHKIITKILNGRLLPLLPQLISSEQTGFIPGRSIHDNIGLAQDLTQDINKKTRGGNIIFKVDMAKAYDKLSWSFIIRVLRNFGFSYWSCDLIFRSLAGNWYSILWAGKKYGFFQSHRGVKQGDPMSPTIFVLAMEFFSRMLNKAFNDKKIGYYSSKSSMKITHSMYADDLLIFANGGKRSVGYLFKTLDDFCSLSGLAINKDKSHMYLSSNIPAKRVKDIAKVSSFKQGSFPFKYLGAFIYKGRAKCNYFSYLVDGVKNKLTGWMKTFLSMAGRAALIQSVLNSICIHTFSCMPVPKKIVKSVQSLIANFLWDCGKDKRRHWISWKSVSLPKEEGGLGLRSVQTYQNLLYVKLAWKFVSNSSSWMQYIRSKRTVNGFDSFIWCKIKSYVNRHRRESTWCFGKGETKLCHLSEWFSHYVPKKFHNWTIRDIKNNPDMCEELISNSLGIFPAIISNIELHDDVNDRTVWTPSRNGEFSISNFYNHCRISKAPILNFQVIWQKWLPPKFSIFLWRALHDTLATDDNIISLGIPLVSKCCCCEDPSMESMEHIFFKGQEAVNLWQILSQVCRVPFPTSLSSLFAEWIRPIHKKDFLSFVSFIAGVLSLWMLWTFRNKRRMEDTSFNCVQGLKHWFGKLSIYIPHGGRDAGAYEDICKFFKLQAPHSHISAAVLPYWKPNPWGTTLSCNIVVKGGQLLCGFAFRNCIGNLMAAECFLVDNDMLLPAINAICSNYPHLMAETKCVQSSHCDMELYANGNSPWEDVRCWRKFRESYPHVKMRHIATSENNLATVIAYLGTSELYDKAEQLPKVALNALISDRRRLCRGNKR